MTDEVTAREFLLKQGLVLTWDFCWLKPPRELSDEEIDAVIFLLSFGYGPIEGVIYAPS